MSLAPKQAARRVGALAGVAGVAALWGLLAVWVLAHPPALASDDALFFLRSLTRFSILDFSPQFPGYPGYVLMGRGMLALVGNPLVALALTSAALALALPLLAWRIGASHGRGVTAALLVLACPLLPDLALSLLSDGAGIALVLAGLALLPQARCEGGSPMAARGLALIAGLALGLALASRPTNLVLVLAAAFGATAASPGRCWPLWLGGALVMIPVLFALLALEPLYITEAFRFVQGHAQLWGNTSFGPASRPTWPAALLAHPALLLLLLAGALCLAVLPLSAARREPASMALVAGGLGHGLWVYSFQNPDNLRHVSALLVIGALAIARLSALAPRRLRNAPPAIALGLCALLHVQHRLPAADALPPVAAAAEFLRSAPEPPAVLITNRGVEALRTAGLPMPVYDAWYGGNAGLAASLAKGEVWRLADAAFMPGAAIACFPGRAMGETKLCLWRIG